MRIPATLTPLVILPFVAVGQGQSDTLALAPDFRNSMQHYASVDRADGRTYRLYINDLAMDAWRSERRLPSGTVFAIESFLAQVDETGSVALDADGRLIAGESENDVHLAMKSDRWVDDGAITSVGLLFGDATTGGEWRMGGFDPRTGASTDGLDIAACHECHVDHRAEDFILSRGLLDRYARSGTPAYISFSCGEREICFGTPRED